MLYYFPLESYKARYTCQLSARGYEGWLESRWLERNIKYKRIEPKIKVNETIKSGCVLDGCQRGIYSCLQIAEFLKLLQKGKIRNDDILYFDDFWTPGLEALSYAFELTGIKPRMYSLLHAQSVDEFDFTFKMLPWIRHFEKGYADIFDGIFVSCTLLADLVYKQGLCDRNKIHVTGLPYNSDKVKELYFPKDYQKIKKKDQIVFSSRWDIEKCPGFFLEVVRQTVKTIPHNIKFIITTSHEKIKSNDPELLNMLYEAKRELPNLELREGLTKKEYYQTLLESKIQFNCADQDFVSWTLLEGLTAQCVPLYPDFRSFKEIPLLPNNKYYKNDVASAVDKIYDIIVCDIFNVLQNDIVYEEIIKFHDEAWAKMYRQMGWDTKC
jgi:glycosyltransferase involved in cell wall biosynthesis